MSEKIPAPIKTSSEPSQSVSTYDAVSLSGMDLRNENTLQAKMQDLANQSTKNNQMASFMAQSEAKPMHPIQAKANNTGLPNQLKSGIEQLSGTDISDVKVHYNSPKPAQLQAHAYAQGSEIHVAPQQEKHLAHEAWHVVQQKQGRVKATRQLKSSVAINDDEALEKESDVMGAKAMQMKVFTENPSKSVIQRKGKTVVQRVQIKEDAGTYYPLAHATGNVVETNELSRAQRQQVLVDLNADAVLIGQIRQGWAASAQALDPVIRGLDAAGLKDSGKKVIANRLYLASQNTGQTLPQLLAAQKAWQDFLNDEGLSKKAIMSVHRSFGMEYEFATWELVPHGNAAVVSHTAVGHSAPFSDLFGVPFVLETDAQEELEMVVPPLLAGAGDGTVNKAFIRNAHALLRTYMVDLRNDNTGVRVDLLDLSPLCDGWNWEDAASEIQVSANRTKWADKPDQIAYQLNISLTPAEIAERIGAVGDGHLDDNHGEVYTNIRQRFLTNALYTGLPSAARRNAIKPAILLLAKGISNSIAIPTLRLVALTREPWPRGDMHSYVKDLHSLWIKDSVPNITVAALTHSGLAITDFKEVLDNIIAGGLIPRYVATHIANYTPQLAAMTPARQELLNVHDVNPGHGQPTALKAEAAAEVTACLAEVSRRLGSPNPTPSDNEHPEFLGEAFGTGDGVRKDTYANIGSSNTSTLHLAELRSNASTDAFLA